VIKCGTLKVAVLMGGIGAEREISIQSGNCVAEALGQAGLNVVTADITPNKMDILQSADIDVFFIALHGEFGEDGQLQEILENQDLIYTGSGSMASKLAFDKMASKRLFSDAGVNVPAAVEFSGQAGTHKLERRLWKLGDKFVIKPQRQGSSVGVSIINGLQDAIVRGRKTCRNFDECIIEEFVPGREITVGILERQALPIIEIKSKTGFYDYQAKYANHKTEYLFDTVEDESLTAKISQAAIDCFDVLGCRDFARVDFILGDDGMPYALEVNTIPGFTTHSLLPKAAAKAGLSMSELCVKIIELAIERRGVRVPNAPTKDKFSIRSTKRKAISDNRKPRLSSAK
jgi:D-alanine-D-alanine ligase